MALNRAAINNSLLNKISPTQSVDDQSIKVLEVGVQKPAEIELDPDLINIDREILGRSSIKSPNLSKSIVDNSYIKDAEEPQSFASKLLNFIEPYDYKGVLKTVFYSELATNYSVGDKVFIINGVYDSPMGTSVDKFEKGVDGYEILAIDGCKIVLDINYTGRKPYNDLDLDDFIFVHNVEDQQEFEYLNSIKTFYQQLFLGTNNTISFAIRSQFSGHDDGAKLVTFSGHLIRVASNKNFTATNQMTPLSIFGRLEAGANGTTPPPDPKYGSKIFFRGLQSIFVGGNLVLTWEDCTQYFAENKILLRDEVSNPSNQIGNKKIYVFGNDFDFNGVTFKEGIPYTFNENIMNWEMDQFYKPAYISKLYFIEGSFFGNHRSGLYGSYNKKNVWEGKGEWQGGTVLNTIWKSGRMDSKTKVGDVVKRAKISPDGRSVVQSVDTTNNSGTGYNDVVDSIIETGTFFNTNFKNCFLGTNVSTSVMQEYFDGEDISNIFNLYTDSSRLDFCDVKNTILSSTTIYDSFVKNCSLVGSKLSNGQIEQSIFDGGEYNADSGITILGAEVNSYDRDIGNPNNNTNIYGILKLFISDQDFFRFSKGDSFYIEKVNKEFFVSSLDEHFRIHLPYETKYILDLYWDYEFSDDDPLKPNSVSVRDKRQNRYKFYVAKNETSQLFIQKATPLGGGAYWEDVTANWKGAWDPNNYDGDILGSEWFYVFYDYFTYQEKLGQALQIAIQEEIELVNPDLPELTVPDDPGASLGNQTFHIFRSRIINPGEVGKPGLGPNINADGYTPYFGWERVNDGLMERGAVDGPFISTAAGQYRGEFSTDPSTIALSIAGGLSYYQIGDVVQFFDPLTLTYQYYRAKQDMPQQIEGVTYDIIDYLAANPNTKIELSENSSFANYCSIDIESTLFGYIKTFRGNPVTSIVDKWSIPKKFSSNTFENLLPFNFIDKAFRNVQIKNAHFNSGLFINSRWTSGSYINDYDNVISKSSLVKYDMAQVDDENTFRNKIYSRYNVNRIKINDYIWIDPITYREGSTKIKLGGTYLLRSLIDNGTTKTFTIKNSQISFFSNASLGSFEIPNSVYTAHASINKLRIENSTVLAGKFRRANFYNTTFKIKSNYIKPQNNLIDPSKVALIINQIFLDNNLTVEGGFVYQSQILEINMVGGYLYFCYANGPELSGGEFINGYWVNGKIDGTRFLNSKSTNPIILQANYLEKTFRDIEPNLQTLWLMGLFQSGEFYDSEWIDGEFYNGKFWKSDWYGGTWSNGILGDKSIPYTKTTFGYYPQKYDAGLKVYLGNSQSNWIDGECQNAIVGGNGRVYWYGGRMIGGEFTSFSYSISTQSVWYGGIFDGSIFTEYAKWKNGIFNNGKFLSKLGSANLHYEDVYKVVPPFSPQIFSQDNADNFVNKDKYGWEYGIFNGGEFGTGDISKTNNSVWFDGIFNGGSFKGRIWRNGILTGGKFYGMGGTKPQQNNLLGGQKPAETSLSQSPNIEPVDQIRITPEYLFWYDYTDFTGFAKRATGNEPYIGFKRAFGEFYGLWVDGYVIENSVDIYSNQKVESELVRATDIKKTKETVLMDKVLWISGTFSHERATIKDSLFVSGNFIRGYFDGGVFNPFLPIDIINREIDYNSGNRNLKYSPIDRLKWTNGTFVTGSFYSSIWQNGILKNGFMAASHWQDGVWEYGTAKNMIFDGGIWKNGNWYGAPFGNSTLMSTGGGIGDRYVIYDTTQRASTWAKTVDYLMSLLPNYKQGVGSDYTYLPNPRSFIYISNIFSASIPKLARIRTGNFPDDPGLCTLPTLPYQCDPETWTYSRSEQNSILRKVVIPMPKPNDALIARIDTKYVSATASYWRRGEVIEYVTATTSITQDGITYIKPQLASLSGGNVYNLHYYTDFSEPTQFLSNVFDTTTPPPYKRGYNNLYKGQFLNDALRLADFGAITFLDVGEKIAINNKDSAPSARIFARRGSTTSVFTQSNVLNTMDLYVSVELAKEVTVDVWVGGLSFSRFNLKSNEFYYPDNFEKDGSTIITEAQASAVKLNLFRTDYFAKFYKISLVYYTTDELLSLKDSKFFWVRKSSGGILRIHRWTINEQFISYHPSYNNFLYPSMATNPFNGLDLIHLPYDSTISAQPSRLNLTTSRQNLPIETNWGNGLFRQGIWESGVWNNGWRANSFDQGFFDSDDILKSNEIFSVVRGIEASQWYITIQFIDSISDYILRGYKLSTGSKVSVSNLASYDTTNKRRVIFSLMEVIEIDFPNNLIKLLYKTQNNISSITKDSDFHLIYLTVNVWKNGAFLNGVFRGIFNNGIIVSNPLHVDMFHTHILNGYFDGGHFTSQLGTVQGVQYQTSLIQEMDFFDRNIGTVGRKTFKTWFDLLYTETSKTHIKKPGSVIRSKRLQGQSYGTSPNYFDPLTSGKVVTSNIMVPNLSGFITNDVLKSSASFRDLNSSNSFIYSLGTKRTRFSNYYPNDGNFSTPISSLPGQQGVSPFQSFGLTFSLIRQQVKNQYAIGNNFRPFTFSVDSNTNDLNNGVLAISVLDPHPLMHNYSFLLRNTQISTLPNRYYEFSVKLFQQTTLGGDMYMDDIYQYMNEKFLLTANATTDPSPLLVGDLTPSSIVDSYVNHAQVPSSEKVEYFFNKNNVDIYFDMRSPTLSSTDLAGGAGQFIPREAFPPGPSAIFIENISLYEVDMIPFFNYFTFGGGSGSIGQIDLSVNSRYSAIAPNLGIINSDFEFVDDDKLKISYELLVEQNPVINVVNVIATYSEMAYLPASTPPGTNINRGPGFPDWPY